MVSKIRLIMSGYDTYIWPILYVISLCILSFYFAHNFELWLDINVWRHDSIYFMDDYFDKFCQEGRWLNFILFAVLKKIPPHISIFIAFSSIFYFFMVCAKPFTGLKNSILFALAGTQISSLNDLLTWPVTSLPSFIIIVCLALLKNKVDWRYIFISAGILLNGSFNNFYNLIPLIFMYEIFKEKINFIHFSVWYIICFIVGHIFAQAIVFITTNNTIQIGGWRQPHEIKCLSDIIFNIMREFHFLHNHLQAIGRMPLLITAVLVCIVCFFQYVSCKNGAMQIISIIRCFIIDTIAMIATYIQAVPLGIYVNLRTAHSLFAGLICIPLLIFSYGRVISVIVLLILTTAMFKANENSLQYYNTITSVFYDNLLKIDIDPRLYKVVFTSSWSEIQMVERRLMNINHLHNPILEGLYVPMRLVPAARAAGFKDIIYTFHDGDDNVEKILREIPDGEFMQNEFYRWRIAGEWLIIGVNWPQTEK